MDWRHVEGTQTEKPLTLDAASSRTVVYMRRNIRRTSQKDETGDREVWEYDEAVVPYADFAAVASAIISASEEQARANQETGTVLEDAVCELSESITIDIALLEQVICELSEEIGGENGENMEE